MYYANVAGSSECAIKISESEDLEAEIAAFATVELFLADCGIEVTPGFSLIWSMVGSDLSLFTAEFITTIEELNIFDIEISTLTLEMITTLFTGQYTFENFTNGVFLVDN